MDKKDIEIALANETTKLVQLRENYENAKAELSREIRQDSKRADGSMRQEALREQIQETLRREEASAESNVRHQEKVVNELIVKYTDPSD